MRSTTLPSLAWTEPRAAITSWRPVRISRAETAAEVGMADALSDAKRRCHAGGAADANVCFWVEGGRCRRFPHRAYRALERGEAMDAAGYILALLAIITGLAISDLVVSLHGLLANRRYVT